MAGGGTWLSQNKIRPGAYLNFESVPKSMMTVGDRGIMIIPLELSWGDNKRLIPVLSIEMLTGVSLHKVGFTAFDEESKLLNLGLQNCYKALVFRTNGNGVKATATLGDLIVTALYSGTLGNQLEISIEDIGEGFYEVRTFLNTDEVDMQKVETIEELKANKYVEFSGEGELIEFAGEMLEGGENGKVTAPSEWLPKFLNLASMSKWQTMAMPIEDASISKNILTYITNLVENQGKYVEAVVCNYPCDSDYVFNSTMGTVIDGTQITPPEFVAWVTGACAGARIIDSNTAKIVIGATDIIGELDDEGIKESIKRGEFVLSRTDDEKICVERDINSYTSYTTKKNKAFRKGRVKRTLNEIGTTISFTWNSYYKGKTDNNALGRNALRGDIITYLNELQRIGAIEGFKGAEDVSVEQGEDIDAVVVVIRVKPVDSMEFLYLTVKVDA